MRWKIKGKGEVLKEKIKTYWTLTFQTQSQVASQGAKMEQSKVAHHLPGCQSFG